MLKKIVGAKKHTMGYNILNSNLQSDEEWVDAVE